jgi:hypothetical protein
MLPLSPMKRTGYYILITLFLFLYAQGLTASVSNLVSSYDSPDLPLQNKYVLPEGSETSAKSLPFTTIDFIILAIVDDDNETDLSLQKNKSTIITVCYKNTQWGFMLLYSDVYYNYQLPYSIHLSSPEFIAFRALRI